MKTGVVFFFITLLSLNTFALSRKCGTEEPSLAHKVLLNISAQKSMRVQSKLIEVVVHYISRSRVDEAAVASQINVLNDAYREEGFQFELVKTNAVRDRGVISAFSGSKSSAEREKEDLREGGAEVLNVYFASLNLLLGWATFPWDVERKPLIDGVVVEIATLPGRSSGPFSLGQTLTHEVGHWLGLYHTFQGGCSGRGDLIADTQAHSRPTYGCPTGATEYCNGQTVVVPISNFMNYADDICMTEFTPLQGERMQTFFTRYRD